MKSIKMKWFPVTLLAVAGMIFTACENSDSINYNVVTINMLNEENGKTLINIKKTVYHDSDEITAEANLSIAKDNNFILSAPDWDSYNAKNKNNCFFFCDAGKKGISSVKKVPTEGWTQTQKIAVLSGHCYIIKWEYTDAYWNGHNNEKTFLLYWKLYVKEYIKNASGEIIGAEVQYCEWEPKE
ncbi:MAG: hypothetical protein II970_02095 [Paludibacteraceae bacterium]|nr:hypothetical protein [Paludibacteraceae bacterium]